MDDENLSHKPTKRKRDHMSKEPKPKGNNANVPKPKPKPKRPKITVEPDRYILVSVDFGTTFSGLAIAQSRMPEILIPINQWPGPNSESRGAVSSDKVPTEIQYDGHTYKWGSQIGPTGQRYQMFKLDLDPSQIQTTDLASQYPDPLKAPITNDGQAVEITTDFLISLRMQTEWAIRQMLPESALISTPTRYVITTPAVWSNMAQDKTIACAKAAGMGEDATIVTEPEAAAISALHDLGSHNLRVGETFVLCDAGGGTVDLITYSVSSLNPILTLTEASPGNGSLCGASFLNRRFQVFLENKLKDQANWHEWHDEILEEAMKYFEIIVKKHFCGTLGEEYFIPVSGIPDNKELRISRYKMTVLSTDIQAIFDPVIKEVLKLVMGQIKATRAPVKAVIMVGGFGQSGYLQKIIRREVQAMNIEVLSPANSWTAVVRGALMKGLTSTTVKIGARLARRHYGVCVGFEYSASLHDRSHRVWDGFSGNYRVYMMDWFIKKSKPIKENGPIRLPYYIRRSTSKGSFTAIKVAIFFCDDPDDTGAPKYKEDVGVKKLVEVEADLSRIPKNLIPQQKGADGKMYYNVDYKIQVSFFSAKITYELIYKGVNYGLVSAEYV